MPPIVSEEYKRKKKKEILTSALACFARKGFQAATIDDIVAHSRISKGAIYNYFKSKDEIYLELMNEQTKEMNEKLTAKISSFNTAIDKILYLFELYITSNPFEPERKDSVVVHYEFRLHSSRDVNLQQLLQARGNKFFIEFLKDLFEEGKKSGEFKEDIDSHIMANLFWTMVDGATIQAILYKEFPYEKVLKTIKLMIMNEIMVKSLDLRKDLSIDEDHGKVDMFMDRIILSLV